MTEGPDQRWFAGVPVIGERVLQQDELDELQRVRREILNAALKTYATFVALVLWFIIAETLDLDFIMRWSAIALLLLFLARGGGMRAARHVRWYRDTADDARRGIVEISRGPAAKSVIDVALLEGHDRLTVFRDEETLTVEVLPRSAMLWSYNGRRTVQPMFVRRSRTSAAPEHARMAANFVKPVDGAEGLYAHQRRLNESESEELRAYLPVVQPFQTMLAAAMVIMGAGFVASAVKELDFIVIAGGTGLILIGGTRLFWTAHRLRFRKNLHADVEENIVVIVRETVDGELAEPIEFLPHSRWMWTHNGEPATWRRISARR